MHVNTTKFERNSSLEYHHMTDTGKTKHTSLRGLLGSFSIDDGYGSENVTFKMN